MEEEQIKFRPGPKARLTNELAQIKKWFLDNDWKVNKIITGEWSNTDPRWLEYLQERSVKRARQDEINELLKCELR